jgi:predicted phage tail component-like protein
VYHLIVENEKGEQLELTNNRNYDVLEVTGTNPPVAAINTVNVAGMDGSRFNSSRVEQRNIVITLNIHHPIEANRLTLYSFFRVKRWVKIYYQNSRRKVYIEGYVESFENNPWTQLQQPQISIICPKPFWLATADTTVNFSYSSALFEFPFSIPSGGIEFSRLEQAKSVTVNAGEIETGGIIQFYATTAQILNPKFFNRTTQTFFGLDFDMYQYDLITVNTQQGEKSVTLLRDGVTSNLLADRTEGSTWVTFVPDVNEVSFEADEGAANLEVTVTITQKFEGV